MITKGLNSDPLVWDLDSSDSATQIDLSNDSLGWKEDSNSEGESGNEDECESQEEDKEHPTIEPNYHPMQIVGDNFDLHIKSKHITLDKRDKSLHWFHLVATEERVVPSLHLPNTGRRKSILSIDDIDFLPSETGMLSLRTEFAHLVSRIVVSHLDGLSHLRDSVCWHMGHEHQCEASCKSTKLPLGLLECNESTSQGMMDIVRFVNQKYVPYLNEGTTLRVQFTGDQKTAERFRSTVSSVLCEDSQFDRMEGLFTHSEDFHCSMAFTDLIFQLFWDQNSYSNIGTLSQLSKSALRRKVSNDVMHNYQRCSDFIQDTLEGYIVACAMNHFGINNATDKIEVAESSENSKEWLHAESLKIVDCLVASALWDSVADLKSDLQQLSEGNKLPARKLYRTNKWKKGRITTETSTCELINNTLSCQLVTCKETFFSAEQRRDHEAVCHGISCLDPLATVASFYLSPSQIVVGTLETELPQLSLDHAFFYTQNLVAMALLEMNFKDATKEMDGPRLFRLWKTKKLYFKETGRHKYARESLCFQSDQYALLSPYDAYRQLWKTDRHRYFILM